MAWVVYMLKCADGTLYTGICTDIERRLAEHNHSKRGARYTRSRRPVRLLAVKPFPDRSTACKEEIRVKRLKKTLKLEWANQAGISN